MNIDSNKHKHADVLGMSDRKHLASYSKEELIKIIKEAGLDKTIIQYVKT